MTNNVNDTIGLAAGAAIIKIVILNILPKLFFAEIKFLATNKFAPFPGL